MSGMPRKLAATLVATVLAVSTTVAPAQAVQNVRGGYSAPAQITLRVGEENTLALVERTDRVANVAFQYDPTYVKGNEYCGGTYWGGEEAFITYRGVRPGTFTSIITVHSYDMDKTPESLETYRLECTVSVLDAGMGGVPMLPQVIGVGEPGADANAGAPDTPDAANTAAATAKAKATRASKNKFVSVSACYKKLKSLRVKRGRKALKKDAALAKYAKKRAKELVKRFSHTRPNGKDCLSGIKGTCKGENIACGQKSCAAVTKAWRTSPGHRKNMLSKQFTKVGIAGYRYKGTIYWVQVFAG